MEAPVKILEQLHNMTKSYRLVFKLYIIATMEKLQN